MIKVSDLDEIIPFAHDTILCPDDESSELYDVYPWFKQPVIDNEVTRITTEFHNSGSVIVIKFKV